SLYASSIGRFSSWQLFSVNFSDGYGVYPRVSDNLNPPREGRPPMKRLAFSLGLMTLATVAPILGMAVNPFGQKLSKDQKIVHAVNRLTFGPRPGDVAHVRRVGLEKWINQQLHPERIKENPVLAAKLQPLETLQLATSQIFQTYQRGGPANAVLRVTVNL